MRRRLIAIISLLLVWLVTPSQFAAFAQDKSIKGGAWVGIIKKFGVKANCPSVFVIKSATVNGQSLEIKFTVDGSPQTVAGKIDAANKFFEWTNFDLRMPEGTDTDRASSKFKGTFKDNIFDGYFNAQAGEAQKRGGVLCEGSVQLAPKGSIEGEALLTGKDPKMLRMERQIALLQSSKDSNPNQSTAARAEVEQLAKQRADEEKRIAALRQQQERSRKLEETRLAILRKQQQKEGKRLEALRRDAERKVQELANLKASGKTGRKPSISSTINFGDYHALVIGFDNYKNLTPLKTAVADAKVVADVLKSEYGFKVTLLTNPNHETLLDSIDEFRATLKFKDNLLIYYAGHGWLDKEVDQGYWLPADAKKNRRSKWISNASITDALKGLKAKHVMVVADSCYSGRLVRAFDGPSADRKDPEFLQKMSRKRARVVITSGGLEPVEDGSGNAEHSPFAAAFLDALNANKDVLDGTKLFNTIRRPVMVNANQTPQYSDVRRAGHDGGDFLFVRKR
ncbi:MAG: hypothetical protein HN731_07775 [Rhodospirillaceae bacterium]|jgi:hypothetical protein|nr:hypothetical protein [Rhodospirillaceae bacterium]